MFILWICEFIKNVTGSVNRAQNILILIYNHWYLTESKLYSTFFWKYQHNIIWLCVLISYCIMIRCQINPVNRTFDTHITHKETVHPKIPSLFSHSPLVPNLTFFLLLKEDILKNDGKNPNPWLKFFMMDVNR